MTLATLNVRARAPARVAAGVETWEIAGGGQKAKLRGRECPPRPWADIESSTVSSVGT